MDLNLQGMRAERGGEEELYRVSPCKKSDRLSSLVERKNNINISSFQRPEESLHEADRVSN